MGNIDANCTFAIFCLCFLFCLVDHIWGRWRMISSFRADKESNEMQLSLSSGDARVIDERGSFKQLLSDLGLLVSPDHTDKTRRTQEVRNFDKISSFFSPIIGSFPPASHWTIFLNKNSTVWDFPSMATIWTLILVIHNTNRYGFWDRSKPCIPSWSERERSENIVRNFTLTTAAHSAPSQRWSSVIKSLGEAQIFFFFPLKSFNTKCCQAFRKLILYLA